MVVVNGGPVSFTLMDKAIQNGCPVVVCRWAKGRRGLGLTGTSPWNVHLLDEIWLFYGVKMMVSNAITWYTAMKGWYEVWNQGLDGMRGTRNIS